MTNRSRFQLYRDHLRGGPPQPRKLKPHGTVAAARRHQRAREPLCEPCAVKWAEHQAEMYRQRKETR